MVRKVFVPFVAKIDYGDAITFILPKKILDKFQTLQDRALKICLKQQVNISRLDLRDMYTRHRDAVIFNVQRPTCKKYKKNIFYFGSNLWNDLPVKVKKIETYHNEFKRYQKSQKLL